MTADQRVTYAREFLAGARKRKVDTLPPSVLMRELAEARRQLGVVLAVVGELEERVTALERQTPQARQLQYEADLAAADLAASGYDGWPPMGADRHGPGCLCPYCPPGEDEEESP